MLLNAVENTNDGEVFFNINFDIDNSKLIFEITDQGVGIKPEDQRTLFKMFKTIDQKGVDPNQLLFNDKNQFGLGLIICKQIIEQYNGKLDFISEYTVGSTFVFSFEVEAEFNSENSGGSAAPRFGNELRENENENEPQ